MALPNAFFDCSKRGLVPVYNNVMNQPPVQRKTAEHEVQSLNAIITSARL